MVCRSLEVASPLALVATMYSTQRNSMTIPLTMNMWHKTTIIEVLLDCGATHNFIDPRAVKSLGVGIKELRTPLTVNNVDGTITHFCNLWARQGSKTEKLGFYVANLGHDQIILGYPWFRLFNPKFDWSKNTLKGDTVEIDTAGYRQKQRTQI